MVQSRNTSTTAAQKFHDENCKNTYLPETDLISQLIEIVDRIDINQVGIKGKLEKEFERYSDFRSKGS